MEQLESMKLQLLSCIQNQMGNLEKVDTHELGEAIDMLKDISMCMYYCSVVEAMEKAEEEAKENGQTVYYTERYLPMYLDRGMRDRYMDEKYSRYYDGPRFAGDDRMSDGRYAPDRDGDGRMNESRRYTAGDRRYHGNYPYYDFNEPVVRDMREGRSPLTRRMYMEAKQQHQGKEVQIQELEKYMGELSQDITEMITDATPEEKQMLHTKLAALTNKIDLLNKSQGV